MLYKGITFFVSMRVVIVFILKIFKNFLLQIFFKFFLVFNLFSILCTNVSLLALIVLLGHVC